jgi:hypothetical protein
MADLAAAGLASPADRRQWVKDNRWNNGNDNDQ